MVHSRIVLYSDQEIPENRQVDLKLVSLLSGTDKTIAYVASNPDESRLYFKRKRSYYAAYGINLAEYFDREILKSSSSRQRLISYSAIHLSGGNTFEFRNWVFSQGMDKLLVEYSNSGGMLIGTSAGAILITPDISTSLLCGDVAPDQVSETNGLGLVNFHIWPHYTSSVEAQINIDSLIDSSKPLYKIPDGSGIIVSHSKIELIGITKY